jgi:hypothetical protein
LIIIEPLKNLNENPEAVLSNPATERTLRLRNEPPPGNNSPGCKTGGIVWGRGKKGRGIEGSRRILNVFVMGKGGFIFWGTIARF